MTTILHSSIRFFLVLILVSSIAFAEEPNRPQVGAIRWDAWSGGDVTKQVERTLGSKKFRDRLPWFAEVLDDEHVRIVGGTQEIMDREIGFAAEAGLDYWAFVLYPEDQSMSLDLKLYRQSKVAEKLKFCGILHNNLGVSAQDWPKEQDRFIDMLKDPNHVTVLEGRPLVYLFGGNMDRFKQLRETVAKTGLNPYYVYMGWNPPRDYADQKPNGFDAVSAYASGDRVKTFAELSAATEGRWRFAAEKDIRYIPLVTTGWDKQPRKEHPVSWELNDAYHQQDGFPSQATPEQIVEHLRHAMDFVQNQPKVCEAGTVIMYAWNEHDEGGWLSPTWKADGKADTSRLDAVRSVLKPDRTQWMKDAELGLFVHFLPGKDTFPLVDDFDVEALAKQLEEVGAGYFVITMYQNSGWFNAPNAAYDKVTGYQAGERCAKRDLILDLHKVLAPRNIKLMVYLTGQVPNRDSVAQKAFGLLEGPKDQKLSIEFAKKWAVAFQEWSDRYGDKVSGWWVDGCYSWCDFNEEIAQIYRKALHHGNPEAVVAFNPGVLKPEWKVSEYTAGEINEPLVEKVESRWKDGAQVQILTYLGTGWGKRDVRYSDRQWSDWINSINSGGGTVTLDVGPNWTKSDGPIGTIGEPQMKQLRAIRAGILGTDKGKD